MPHWSLTLIWPPAAAPLLSWVIASQLLRCVQDYLWFGSEMRSRNRNHRVDKQIVTANLLGCHGPQRANQSIYWYNFVLPGVGPRGIGGPGQPLRLPALRAGHVHHNMHLEKSNAVTYFLQSISLTSYFYKNIYLKVIHIYFYENTFQDKFIHIALTFPN
jgi:hypothetical protein